jgi:branched-chain amino acid transport system permease protein
VQPHAAYDVQWSAFMIFIVVIGGMSTIEGPIVGTVAFFTLQKQLANYGAWYLIILGAVAVLAAVWMRGGIWGVVGRRVDVRLFPVQRRVRGPAGAVARRKPKPAPGG